MDSKNYQKPSMIVVKIAPTQIICESPPGGGGTSGVRESRDGWYNEE